MHGDETKAQFIKHVFDLGGLSPDALAETMVAYNGGFDPAVLLQNPEVQPRFAVPHFLGCGQREWSFSATDPAYPDRTPDAYAVVCDITCKSGDVERGQIDIFRTKAEAQKFAKAI